jgi:hypothetical protein
LTAFTQRELDEYRTLRDTIRERGTTRFWVALAGLTAWGALVLATAALMPVPVATILPLLILATAFEIVFSLHTGVERIGRYIQVFFEEDAAERRSLETASTASSSHPPARWEHAAMGLPSSGLDPLFANFFRIAAILNIVPAAFARPMPVEWAFIGVIHAMFILRVAIARRQAGRQRALDLEHFQRLKRG